MELDNMKSSSFYIEDMKKKCRKKYEELSAKYAYNNTGLSEEEKLQRDKEIEEVIRFSIENEFGYCYL